MNSHYGLKADGRNLLYSFYPHGNKDWNSLQKIFVTPEEKLANQEYFESLGSIILHDQEPFDRQLLNTYKKNWSEIKNIDYIKSLENSEFIHHSPFRMGGTIFCHSEINSEDIDFVERSGMIPCYYFYHGLIARDWFRHWKHHGSISPVKEYTYRFLLYARETTGSRKYRENLINDLRPLQTEINYNWQNQTIVSPDYSAKISVEDSMSSAIHIVAETIFDKSKIHLTEKIFKPMVMMQPFILFAGPGSLEYLRNYGFRTFSDIWDESYDVEQDHVLRYQKLVDLIKRLSSLPKKEFDEILKKTQDIIEHNHRHFFGETFEKTLLDELHHNMEKSLIQQEQKLLDFPGGEYLCVQDCLIKSGKQLDLVQKEKIKKVLLYLRKTQSSRFERIIEMYPWISDILV